MVEIRSYEGTPDALSDFVVAQWQSTYRGAMAVPRWSGDFFRWQLGMDEPGPHEHVVAAYDGSRLVGVVGYFPMQFAFDEIRFAGSQASWLSVSPDAQGTGVARRLIEAVRTRHRERGLRFQFGFAYYGHRASRAPRFWRDASSTTTTIRNAGFWVRVLDPIRAIEWNRDSFQRRMTRLAAPFSGIPPISGGATLVVLGDDHRDVSPTVCRVF